MIDPDLREFATETECRYLDALDQHGTYRAASQALQCSEGTISGALARVRKRAALRGYAPDHEMRHPSAPGFGVTARGTFRNADGEITSEAIWEKPDKHQQESIFLEGVQAALARFEGGAPRVLAPKKSRSDKLTVYPVADLHLGAYAWGDECGEDYDTDIAQRLIYGAMAELVESAPSTEECLVVDLGDLVHADSPQNETERSGAKLDVDTRWQRIADIAATVLISCVEAAKAKHKTVRVRKAFGNHDPNTSRMLNVMLKLYYSKDRRVIVEDSPSAFWYYRFGKVLLGVTHGDKTKPQDLPGIMAADVPEDWGASTCRMWLTGHIHHLTRKEYPGCVVETFRSLAAKDAYHAHHGFRSERDMQALVFDASGKLKDRHHVGVDEIEPRAVLAKAG